VAATAAAAAAAVAAAEGGRGPRVRGEPRVAAAAVVRGLNPGVG